MELLFFLQASFLSLFLHPSLQFLSINISPICITISPLLFHRRLWLHNGRRENSPVPSLSSLTFWRLSSLSFIRFCTKPRATLTPVLLQAWITVKGDQSPLFTKSQNERERETATKTTSSSSLTITPWLGLIPHTKYGEWLRHVPHQLVCYLGLFL